MASDGECGCKGVKKLNLVTVKQALKDAKRLYE